MNKDTSPAAAPKRPRTRVWALGALLALVALVVVVLVTVTTLPRTASGTRWLLGWVPGLALEGADGALLGDFAAARVVYRLNATQTLTLEHLRWQGLGLGFEGSHWRLHIARLDVDRVALGGQAAPHTGPTVLPSQLALPLAVDVDALRIGRIDADALGAQPVQDVQAALHLGAGNAARHRVDGLRLRWAHLQAEGRLQVQAGAPLGLDAQLALAPTADATAQGGLANEWRAQLSAQGPLARFTARATVRARSQTLDAEATVQPASALGVTSLRARADAFDLAALSDQLPRTALSGEVDAQLDPAASAATGQLVTLNADVRNALAGRVDEGRLPLRRVTVDARSQARAPQQGDLRALMLELGTASTAAGRIDAQGTWRPRDGVAGAPLTVALTTRLTDLRPAVLDHRAPALALGGTVQLGWQQQGASSVKGTLRGQVLNASPSTARAAPAPAPAANPPITVTLDAQGTPDALTLRSLEAVAGAARLSAHGEATHSASGWATTLAATWHAFDPSLWWPGANAAWRRGPHRLDGQLDASLRLPDAPNSKRPAAQGAMDLLARLQGQASAQLAPSSVLAGVPLAGTLRFESGPTLPTLNAQFKLGSGAETGDLSATGQLARDGQGAADRWTLRWALPALAPLSPWLRLAQGNAADAASPATPNGPPVPPPLAARGDLSGDLTVTGRWPQTQASGQLTSKVLAVGPSGQPAQELRELAAQWQLGSRPGDTLALDARMAGAKLGTLRLENPHLQLTGTGAAHRLQLDGIASAINTGETSELPRRVRAQVQAEGGWFDLPGKTGAPTGWGWQGRLAQATLGDVPTAIQAAAGKAPPPAAPWLSLQPTGLRWQQQGERRELAVDATRLTLGDAALALEPVRWQQDGGAGPQFTLRGQLEPWAVAPLLARTQPGFGWGGDLRLTGSLAVQATPQRFTAQVELQRERGDLQVLDPEGTGGGPQALGLTALRLALQADQGQWRLTEQLAGSRLGSVEGEQRVQAPTAAWVPPATAPLSGRLALQVAQLGQLGNVGRWLPPGWRLAGRLAGQAELGGQLGAPQVRGELRGDQIAVRSLLEGVDWHDATLRLRLDGERARIEQFDVRAGAGRLTATGSAELGATPRLEVQARAERFAVLQRVDRRVVVSGDGSVVLDAKATRVTAQLTADEGRIDVSRADAPSLASDVQVHRASDPAAPADGLRSAGPAAPGAPGSAATARQTQIDVRADLGPAFMLRGRGVTTRLAGALHVTSPANRLQVAGTIRAVDGTYAAYGQKLGIERGLVSFAGSPENPRLDILAVRSDLDEVRVGVAITGNAQAPRVRLYSDPSMSDTDKLSWLMLGRASDGLGGTDLALLQRAAYALLAGENDSPGVVQRLGLDNLSVGQKDDGTVRETVVSLGKQLSRRWYVGYERSLQTTAGSWQLIYRLAQRFTLRAQSGSVENALDLIWTWRWGE